LCAILKGTEQIFWFHQRMPLSPRAFQGPKMLLILLWAIHVAVMASIS
jgi:hypothetical protein